MCSAQLFENIGSIVSTFSSIYCPPGYADQEDRQGNIIPGDWRSQDDNGLSSIGSNQYSSFAKQLRDTLTNYFNSTAGALAWQQALVTSI